MFKYVNYICCEKNKYQQNNFFHCIQSLFKIQTNYKIYKYINTYYICQYKYNLSFKLLFYKCVLEDVITHVFCLRLYPTGNITKSQPCRT